MKKKDIIRKSKPVFKLNKGVYFLINKNEIVYVGSSIKMEKRLAIHTSNDKFIFDRYYFLPCEDYELKEIEYILKFNPKYNSNISNNCKILLNLGYISEGRIKKISSKLNKLLCEKEGWKFVYFRSFLKRKEKNKIITPIIKLQHKLYLITDILKTAEEFYGNIKTKGYQLLLKEIENIYGGNIQ